MELTINGARIHYERAGQGLPVIFRHAGVADSRPRFDCGSTVRGARRVTSGSRCVSWCWR
jgi:hypothetical protein